MEIASIVAFLAFFIAMIALWLTSDVIKKVESQNEKFLHAHLKSLRADIKKISLVVQKLKTETDHIKASSEEHDQRLNDHTKTLDTMSVRIADLRANVESIDHSIPQRYRTKTTRQHDNDKKSVCK